MPTLKGLPPTLTALPGGRAMPAPRSSTVPRYVSPQNAGMPGVSPMTTGDCGCWPNPPVPPGCWPWPPDGCGDDLIQCWGKIQALTQIVQSIIDSSGGPVKTGPIVGVVDGSNANPGEVGEFVQYVTPTSTVASGSTTIFSVGVLQPGDWDVWASVGINSAVSEVSAQLSVLPSGVSSLMFGYFNLHSPSSVDDAGLFLNLQPARASLTIPTLFPFQVTLFAAAATPIYVAMEARRRR
jgi:hypothetical protein